MKVEISENSIKKQKQILNTFYPEMTTSLQHINNNYNGIHHLQIVSVDRIEILLGYSLII